MSWTLKGLYVASCSCTNVCPCSTASAPPDNPDGTTICWGLAVFDVREGNLDDLDLSGTRVGMYVSYPGLVSDGNWKLGIALGPEVADDKADALEQILSGKLGGPFGDMAPLIAEFTTAREDVSFSESECTVGGKTYSYEALRGQDGSPTMMSNAVFGFAPSFEIGNTKGRLESFGHQFDASYGEAADFEYSSETHEHIRA